MAIFQLISNNPDFSYIIAKNPSSGMSIKTIRKGNAFAWYSTEDTYNVYFKDADNEISYREQAEEMFEYLNTTRYCSTLFPLNAINTFFSSALKKLHEKDQNEYESSVLINAIHVKNISYLNFFQRHLNEFDLTFEELASKTYQLRINTTKTIHELLHYTTALCVFLSIVSDEYIDFTDDVIRKYITSMQVIDAPYYIRYLFARNVLNSRKKFLAFKHELEKTNHYKIEFKFGNTARQRQEWISEQLKFERSILDIGCGEGAYAIPYSQKISEYDYFAIDIDAEIRERLKFKINNKVIENIAIYESLTHFLEFYDRDLNVDVLLTEVVEHMSVKDATKLVKSVLSYVNFENFIITTPNAEFNNLYQLDGFRHDDHKWEMTKEEFVKWIDSILSNTTYSYTFSDVGDRVDGISLSQAVVITKQKVKEHQE
ncbi:class I SAM-dependent methyltransferase [Gottfriedia acidiceleris]|uniref:class I SAM-dependent methyltransferase n=1 Tax=Gottfriedia acidiceleris TaxID=371036 RepID=UPI00101BC4BA|nr:class I SAM-dependent methyltransferase [Gottfriedia acidiceleris]